MPPSPPAKVPPATRVANCAHGGAEQQSRDTQERAPEHTWAVDWIASHVPVMAQFVLYGRACVPKTQQSGASLARARHARVQVQRREVQHTHLRRARERHTERRTAALRRLATNRVDEPVNELCHGRHRWCTVRVTFAGRSPSGRARTVPNDWRCEADTGVARPGA
jgi:hypothetical protein